MVNGKIIGFDNKYFFYIDKFFWFYYVIVEVGIGVRGGLGSVIRFGGRYWEEVFLEMSNWWFGWLMDGEVLDVWGEGF